MVFAVCAGSTSFTLYDWAELCNNHHSFMSCNGLQVCGTQWSVMSKTTEPELHCLMFVPILCVLGMLWLSSHWLLNFSLHSSIPTFLALDHTDDESLDVIVMSKPMSNFGNWVLIPTAHSINKHQGIISNGKHWGPRYMPKFTTDILAHLILPISTALKNKHSSSGILVGQLFLYSYTVHH